MRQKILRQPILYLSLYFKIHRQHYYDLLNQVRLTGNWEAWLDFFAEVVITTTRQAMDTLQELTELAEEDRTKVQRLGRLASSALKIHLAMLEQPIATPGG